jgi:hypothetical protein
VSNAARQEADVARVRALAVASGGRIGIVTLPSPGRARFVLDLAYATVGSAIDLAARHPFQPPLTTVLTPVFHPHVFASGVVCIGARWIPSEGMDLFVRRIVRLLAFDPLLMNPQSIANGVAQAWYALALQRHPAGFPTDAAALLLAAPAPRVVRHCPHCGAALRLPGGRSGIVACPQCRRDFEVTT